MHLDCVKRHASEVRYSLALLSPTTSCLATRLAAMVASTLAAQADLTFSQAPLTGRQPLLHAVHSQLALPGLLYVLQTSDACPPRHGMH